MAVARSGSFSAAARALETDPSTVSRRVGALERELGRSLFERTARGLLPTRHGGEMVEAAAGVERAMHVLSDAARRTERDVVGRVRVTLTESLAQYVVIPTALGPLLAAHPRLELELLTSEDAKDLVRQEADIAVRFFRTPRGELVGRRVAKLTLAILASRSLARSLAGVPFGQLPWIGYERAGIASPETAYLSGRGVERPRLVCSSVESQISAVRAGLGVALAARSLLRAHDDLVVLETDARAVYPSLEVFVVTRRAIRDVPRIAAVFDALVSSLQAIETG